MKITLFILHFQPIEGYPPILNLLDYLSNQNKFKKLTCITNKGPLQHIYLNKSVTIKRKAKLSENKIIIWLSYFIYNLSSILNLLIERPSDIIYYETISSFPVYFYKTYINKKVNIYIHYHEYTTKTEYKSSSIIIRLFHQLEQKIYAKAKWISHTNQTRLNNFLTDNNISSEKGKHFLLPNYPSRKWGIQNTKRDNKVPIKIVFIGYGVNPKSSFILELIDYLKLQQQEIFLDIYCLKRDSLPKNYTGKLNKLSVKINPAVKYNKLPLILKNYHIGLILYNATTENVINCAPNKLFEYLACDLDVWFPKEMEGCYPYENKEGQPKVLKLDFNNLNQYKLDELIGISNSLPNRNNYHYENVYEKMINEII
jgi:hypothetical protein